MDAILPIEQLVRDLKVDRDTWQAVALQFKAAFEAQTARMQELQDICFATQAELENERAHCDRGHNTTALTESHSSAHSDALAHSLGTATIYSSTETNVGYSRRSLNACMNPSFDRAYEHLDQKKYSGALTHVERLLRGPLSFKARAEGLLLKSIILRSSGPEEMFDALAACSEAIEHCNRLSELGCFLPQIQHQCNLLCHELLMLHQARGDFGNHKNHDHKLLPQTSEFSNSEDEEPDLLPHIKRRSGFDENRNVEGLLVQLNEKTKDVRRISSLPARCGFVLIMPEQTPSCERTTQGTCCGKDKTDVVAIPLGQVEKRLTKLQRIISPGSGNDVEE